MKDARQPLDMGRADLLCPRAGIPGCFDHGPRNSTDAASARRTVARASQRSATPVGRVGRRRKRMPRNPSHFGPSVLRADNQQRL